MQGIQYSPWLIYYMPDGFVKFNSDKEWIKRDYRTNIFAAWKEVDAVLRDYYVNNGGQIKDDGSTDIQNNGISYFKDFSQAFGKFRVGSVTGQI